MAGQDGRGDPGHGGKAGVTMNTTPSLPVGIHENVPFETYCRLPYLNHSALKAMDKSPRAFKHALEHSSEPNDGQRLGTGLHALVLEPERLADMLIDPPINPKTGKAYGSDTNAWAEYAASHPGKLILSAEERERLNLMVKSLHANPLIREHLEAPARHIEETMIWDCPLTGMRCKGRVDLRHVGVARLDVKSSRSGIDPQTFRSTLIRFGYHTQDAFYAIGASVLNLPEKHHYIAAVESEGDHDSALYEIDDATRSLAISIVTGWLKTVKSCRDNCFWPGVQRDATTPLMIGAPLWYMQKWNDGEVGDVAA